MNIPSGKPSIGKEEIEAATKVLKSGMFVSGKYVEEFEKMFAKYTGTRYAISCNSGTAALHMTLLSVGIGHGDEVIVPPIGFFATVSSVLMTGATPVFCDVNKYGNIDHTHFETLVNEKTKAIIPVHLYGMPCDIYNINKIAKKYDIKVIEDCAQAHGSEYKKMKCGSLGDAGCFSFYATKNMTTLEGGMITTNNEEIAYKTKRYRNHGMIDRETHSILGYNYRMNELQAAIGIEQLKKLDMFNAKRREYARILYEKIESFDNKLIINLYSKKDILSESSCYFSYPVVYSSYSKPIDCFLDFLKEKKILHRRRYSKNFSKQPIFKRKKGCYLPNTDMFINSVVGLPCYSDITKDETDYIINSILEFCRNDIY